MSEETPIPPSTRVIHAAFDFIGRNWVRILVSLGTLGVTVVLVNGIYIVKKEEQGVRTRFGRVVDAEVGPGVHYRFPVIEVVYIRPVKRIVRREIASKSGDQVNFTILSGDTNLLEIDVALQYRINDLRNYLFTSAEPEELLTMIAREELVEGIGQNFIDLIFTSNRSIIENHLFEATAKGLAPFDIGIELTAMTIMDVRPIDETLAAFRDVNDAIAERAQAESEANRKRERFLARSRGQAQALILNAKARARERVGQARSAAQAFVALLEEYRSQPAQVAITRYWQRMRTIFAQASLAAVNPGDTSTIDINMIDGVGTMPFELAVGSPPLAGPSDDRVLASSTSPTELHLGHDKELDQLTMDGRFHNRLAERDHLGAATPRSLIFDSPSIFTHRHVPRVGPVLEQPGEQRPLIETIPTESPARSATGKEDNEEPGG